MTVLRSLQFALGLLSRRDRRLLGAIVAAQVLLSLLDLLAVALIGIVVLLAAGQAVGALPMRVQSLLENVKLDVFDPLTAAVYLAACAGVLMVSKSLLSFYVTRRVFRFLAARQAVVSSQLASRLVSQPLMYVQSRSSQDVAYSLTIGVNALIMGIIGQASIAVAEMGLLTILTLGLCLIDPTVTIFTIVFFTVVGVSLQRLIGSRASRIGKATADTQVASYEAIQEIIRTYRETSTSGRRGIYIEGFQELRNRFAQVQAEDQILGQVSKYVFEVALIIGGAILATSQFVSRDVGAAAAIIAVFLAAASRVMPSLLRLQAATMSVRVSVGISASAVSLAKGLASPDASSIRDDPMDPHVRERIKDGLEFGFNEFSGEVDCASVSITFPSVGRPAVSEVTIFVPPASSLGIVGSTGAGKSTLVDLMLGIVQPDSGSVSVSGVAPELAALMWPGAMAYVPQDTTIIRSDIRANVALGLPADLIDDERVWEALDRAHLGYFLREQREGLATYVGEGGVRLSGGQKQRLGIARALYTRPKLLVLDEATSALDAETEDAIARTLRELSGQVTLVVVAHRLATIRNADQVIYLDHGQTKGLGTFGEVRSQSKAFDRQARLLGL